MEKNKRKEISKEMGDVIVTVAEKLKRMAKKYDMSKIDMQTVFVSSLAYYLADEEADGVKAGA